MVREWLRPPYVADLGSDALNGSVSTAADRPICISIILTGVVAMLAGEIAYPSAFSALQGMANKFGDRNGATSSYLNSVPSWQFIVGSVATTLLMRLAARHYCPGFNKKRT